MTGTTLRSIPAQPLNIATAIRQIGNDLVRKVFIETPKAIA
ncbi:MAG: hypothetical protein OER80_05220 [Gammaproteobacteria bacterium]|nr:hypothetical protein [Gammaproteobacteria bacterium]